ncbi:hypothetical protein V490_07270 [Pseudogymnoascus sp. VKM F-3557]|nr:hypothetical protein V490_07270 [Pseudogymnoascus sp. VKM F-3557]
MDAGGLAQMSYNNFQSIGVPGSGFASRGKGAHIKRLSFEPTAASDPANNGAPTPRTSRSHLLAGLRTAPKTTTGAHFPPSAPPTQLQHRGLDNSMYSDNKDNSRSGYGGPKTSIGSSFSTQQQQQPQQQQPNYNNRQMYALPEQVLAPPEIHIDEHGQEQMDPNLYAQLVATNMYLAEQQHRLQQQLINVQAAAQQFQGMSLGHMGRQMPQQFATPPVTPGAGMYQQQAKQNGQPIITPVPGGQPGLYSVYNPMTGQQTYYIDQGAQQAYADNQHGDIYTDSGSPPQQPGTPRFQVSPPSNNGITRSISPPKKSASPPQDHTPLPPPSANAFRRGHKKSSSLANVLTVSTAVNVDSGARTSVPKTAGYAPTPMTGTFGPGQGRAGEHPIRQPRGPPPLDELRAKPTSKFEGSKNFATRQRRNAVHNLVRAGLERRRAPGSGSAGSISPISETGELTFATSSGEESDSGRSGSGSLSGRPSLGSLRTSIHGAIGSDRPSSRQKNHSAENNSVDTTPTTAGTSGDEGPAICSFAAAFKHGGKKPEAEQARLKAPMLVLSSVEKRKSSVF